MARRLRTPEKSNPDKPAIPEAPRLRRLSPRENPGDANPPEIPKEKAERIEGIAKSLDCDKNGPRFTVLVGQKNDVVRYR